MKVHQRTDVELAKTAMSPEERHRTIKLLDQAGFDMEPIFYDVGYDISLLYVHPRELRHDGLPSAELAVAYVDHESLYLINVDKGLLGPYHDLLRQVCRAGSGSFVLFRSSRN